MSSYRRYRLFSLFYVVYLWSLHNVSHVQSPYYWSSLYQISLHEDSWYIETLSNISNSKENLKYLWNIKYLWNLGFFFCVENLKHLEKNSWKAIFLHQKSWNNFKFEKFSDLVGSLGWLADGGWSRFSVFPWCSSLSLSYISSHMT